jgi:hypothetical protein
MSSLNPRAYTPLTFNLFALLFSAEHLSKNALCGLWGIGDRISNPNELHWESANLNN